jgi:hypothetical protein
MGGVVHFYFPYLNLAATNPPARQKEIMFQRMIGSNPDRIPYANQKRLPNAMQRVNERLISLELLSLKTR